MIRLWCRPRLPDLSCHTGQLQKVLALRSEKCIFIIVAIASGYYFTAGPLVSQLRAAGVTVPIVGQEGYDSQKFIEIAGPAAEGVIITTSLDRDSTVPETADFIKAFEDQAGFKTDMVAASSHTAVKVAADAIARAGSTAPEKILAALKDTDLKVSTGTIKFNALGEVLMEQGERQAQALPHPV